MQAFLSSPDKIHCSIPSVFDLCSILRFGTGTVPIYNLPEVPGLPKQPAPPESPGKPKSPGPPETPKTPDHHSRSTKTRSGPSSTSTGCTTVTTPACTQSVSVFVAPGKSQQTTVTTSVFKTSVSCGATSSATTTTITSTKGGHCTRLTVTPFTSYVAVKNATSNKAPSSTYKTSVSAHTIASTSPGTSKNQTTTATAFSPFCAPFEDPRDGLKSYCQCNDKANYSFAKGTNPCPYTTAPPKSLLYTPTAVQPMTTDAKSLLPTSESSPSAITPATIRSKPPVSSAK